MDGGAPRYEAPRMHSDSCVTHDNKCSTVNAGLFFGTNLEKLDGGDEMVNTGYSFLKG
jgi:hypothetical protein